MQVSDIYEHTNYEPGIRYYAFDVVGSGVSYCNRSGETTEFCRAKIATYLGSDQPSHEEAWFAISCAIGEWYEHIREELEEV